MEFRGFAVSAADFASTHLYCRVGGNVFARRKSADGPCALAPPSGMSSSDMDFLRYTKFPQSQSVLLLLAGSLAEPMILPRIHWCQLHSFLLCGFPLFIRGRFQFFLLVFAGLFSFLEIHFWYTGKISFCNGSGCTDSFFKMCFSPHSRTITIIIISFASLEADIKWSTCTK